MKAAKVFINLVSVFITFPISVYMGWLLYEHVQATPLMWTLFWGYYPFVLLVAIFSVISTAIGKEK